MSAQASTNGAAPQEPTVKADHPRSIDRYIDFFGGDSWTRLAALDTRTPTADSRTVERRDLTVLDDRPDRQSGRP